MKDKEQILALGMDGLDIIARHINGGTPYSVKVSFSRYGFHIKRATVDIYGKSFTEVGEKCIEKAIKAAIVYAVRTFTNFAEMKEDMEKILGEEKVPCEPSGFVIKKFKK
jgi:hypothetical protein